MEADVSDDLSGDLKNFMVSLMSAGRDESGDIDPELVKQDAQVSWLTKLNNNSKRPLKIDNHMSSLGLIDIDLDSQF